MRYHSRQLTYLLPIMIAFALLVSVAIDDVTAQNSQAYALIDEVNALRAANGLPPYRIDGSLMAAAQAHSDYQASIGSITHAGAGGTRSKDRARAAGYGGGGTIFVSENIAGGSSITVQGVVKLWQGDAPHLNTMLGSNYTDIGAGVTSDGNRTYYTIDVGYIAGQPGGGGADPSVPQPTPVGGAAPAPTSAPVALIQPVIVNVAREDGSIVHLVEYGQTLIAIASTYEITLDELLSLNGLNAESVIQPGDELLIKVAEESQEVTPTEFNTPLPLKPTDTLQIKRIPATPIGFEPAVEIATDIPPAPIVEEISGDDASSAKTNTILIVVGILLSAGTAVVVLGWSLKRSP